MRVAVALPGRYWGFLEEELGLVKTLYSSIELVLKIGKPVPKTYISMDKIEKLKSVDFDKLIVMDRLKPSQLVNLTRELKKDIVDRVLLILEVFAEHAGSREAKLQIELARLRYSMPLVKEAIRYAKIGELHGFLGAGRYGYEKYYLMLKKKEARVRRELSELRAIRELRRRLRVEAGFPHVAITGYTCAGKTSLFNALTGLSKPVGPEPFTTLTPKSSRVSYRDLTFIVTDTVGFIRDLPPEVVEAFYATLEEVSSADVVVNVVDASKPLERISVELETTRGVLARLGVQGRPVIIALNKIDLLGDYTSVAGSVEKLLGDREVLIPVSSLKKLNLDKLVEEIYRVVKR
ncbi:MAG: GTPase HflX [Desulfurococcus sp.]|nr:GTPase HflX [Desulfurococcus sp.]